MAVASALMLDHRDMRRADLRQLFVGNSLAGEFAGERFQALADFEEIAHVVAGQLCGARTAIWQQHDEAVRSENLQGFA